MDRRLVRLLFATLVGVLTMATPSAVLATRRPCVDTTDLVGERKCSRYGLGWSNEKQWPLVLRFGLRHTSFSPRGLAFGGARSFSGEDFGADMVRTYGVDTGFTVFLVGQLYLGLEAAFLFGAVETRSLMTTSGEASISMFQGTLPLGYRIPLGRASLRAEAALGAARISVGHRAVGEEGLRRVSSDAIQGVVEPRLAADFWVSPYVTVGAYGATNILDTGGYAMGLTVAVHHRNFDGAFD